MNKAYLLLGLCLLLMAGCEMSVNRNISIADGAKLSEGIHSINGSIRVGDDCIIRGGCRSINGMVRVGERSQMSELQTINGGITLGRGTTVRKDVQSINGHIQCQAGVNIKGDCDTINGSVEMDSTIIAGNVNTCNGDIVLDNHSLVMRDIVIKRNKHSHRHNQSLDIYLKNGSRVAGDILVNGNNLKVTVHTSTGGEVGGRVENAKLVSEP